MSSWIDSRCSDIAGWIDCVIARDAAASLDAPHVVSVFDRLLGVPTVLGPFPDPVTAAVFADRYVREVNGGEDSESLRIDVVPLERVDATFPSRRRSTGGYWRAARRLGRDWRARVRAVGDATG